METRFIRRASIKRLIRDRFGGSQAQFGRAIERDDAYVWQLVHGKRGVGERIARHIERKLGLPRGELDMAPHELAQMVQETRATYTLNKDRQAMILGLFDRLTTAQQDEFIGHLKAAVASNEAIVREVGGRLSHPTDKQVAEVLPLPPNHKDGGKP